MAPLREQRKYDLVVYGASGFTGVQVVKQLLSDRNKGSLTFAVAGLHPQLLRIERVVRLLPLLLPQQQLLLLLLFAGLESEFRAGVLKHLY